MDRSIPHVQARGMDLLRFRPLFRRHASRSGSCRAVIDPPDMRSFVRLASTLLLRSLLALFALLAAALPASRAGLRQERARRGHSPARALGRHAGRQLPRRAATEVGRRLARLLEERRRQRPPAQRDLDLVATSDRRRIPFPDAARHPARDLDELRLRARSRPAVRREDRARRQARRPGHHCREVRLPDLRRRLHSRRRHAFGHAADRRDADHR